MTMSRAVVRLLSLLLVAVGLIGLTPMGLLVLGVSLCLWVFVLERDLLGLLAQRIWRMRWFFLAIAILYGLGSPTADPWSGWKEGAYRVAVLIVLVTTVARCLNNLPPRELADGIAKLLKPLQWLSMPIDTFARRVAATLDAVNDMSERVRALPKGRSALTAVAQVCEQAETYQIDVSGEVVEEAPAARDIMFVFAASVVLLGAQWLA